MSQTPQFFTERANEAAQEAKQATLDNVRERALRSEAAWRDMAARATRIQEDRETAKRDRERAVAEAHALQE